MGIMAYLLALAALGAALMLAAPILTKLGKERNPPR